MGLARRCDRDRLSPPNIGDELQQLKMEMFLQTVKVASVLIAAVLGVIGTQHEFKSRGKLTRWGRLTVLGIVVTSILAIVAQLAETQMASSATLEAANKAREASLRVETIVSNLNRDLHLINRVAVTIAASIPLTDSHFKEFRDRFDKEVESVRSGRRRGENGSGAIGVVSYKPPQKPSEIVSVTFTDKHRAFPTRADGPCAEPLLMMEVLNIYIFREPIVTTNLKPDAIKRGADLLMGFNYTTQQFGWSKQRGNTEYTVTGIFESQTNSWWDRTGRVIAIPDLSGAQMFIVTGAETDVACEIFTDVKREFEVTSLTIRFNAKEVNLYGHDLIKHQLPDYGAIWEYRFGSSL
jgi:hypothetical protein